MNNPFEELEARQIRIENMMNEILHILRNHMATNYGQWKQAIPDNGDLLRLEDVCKITGFARSTIYDMTCRKAIPHYKKGKTLWFDRNEIEAWIKSGRPAILEGAMKIIRDKSKGIL